MRDTTELAAAWRDARGPAGIRVREVACVGAARTLLVAECGRSDQPAISISAGVHGDEPAGVWALLSLVRDGLLDPRFAYRIWPCLNPTGFDRRTRASVDGIDVNRSFGRGGTSPEARAVLTATRDRRCVLAIDLHEDLEADGAYVYETLVPPVAARYGAPVTRAMVEAGFPVQHFDDAFDLGPPGSEIAQTRSPGHVLVDALAEAPFYGGDLPQGLVTVRATTPVALTIESPARLAPADRVALHRVAIVASIGAIGAIGALGTV